MREWPDRQEWASQYPRQHAVEVEIEVGDWLVLGSVECHEGIDAAGRIARAYRWAEVQVLPVSEDTYDYDAPLGAGALADWIAERPALAEAAFEEQNERAWCARDDR